jgi:hypothetical protein
MSQAKSQSLLTLCFIPPRRLLPRLVSGPSFQRLCIREASRFTSFPEPTSSFVLSLLVCSFTFIKLAISSCARVALVRPSSKLTLHSLLHFYQQSPLTGLSHALLAHSLNPHALYLKHRLLCPTLTFLFEPRQSTTNNHHNASHARPTRCHLGRRCAGCTGTQGPA